jgi:hypothetical protein
MTPGTGACPSRAELLSLLSEACELEHGLLCSYLYSAFSLKQDLAEGGFTWEQQQRIRLWAAQIYAVAAEEMLHLATVWNLLASVGGTPYYYRPSFPVGAKYYRLHLPLQLQPFGSAALKRFIMYELPVHVTPEDMARELGLPADQAPSSKDLTVGELYGLVRKAFHEIPEQQLFIGDPEHQVGQDIADFPDLVRVTDRASADKAIGMIMEQGEGTQADHDDCHFGMFRKVLADFEKEVEAGRKSGRTFEPVRNVAENPVTRLRGERSPSGVSLIEHPRTKEVSEFFDDVYELMMRMLQFVFSSSTECDPLLRQFAKTAIVVMPTVIKPLGEALTLMPLRESGDLRAGPSFGLSRHVVLPTDPDVAAVVVRERLEELRGRGERLAEPGGMPVQFTNAAVNLGRYARV